MDGLEMLQTELGTHGLLIKSQNDGFDSYQEGLGWYGSLEFINSESMYMVRASEPCVVNMTGPIAKVTDHPITLNNGLTWIGFPMDVSMSLEDAMSGFTPSSGDVLKSQSAGFSSYQEGLGWYGALMTLSPGMGLMYKSTNPNPVTFTYPTSTAKGEQKANLNTDNNYWKPNLTAYPYNMSVMAVVELDNEELQGENYELAAFANGECRGSVRLLYVEPLNRYIAFLTVAGDEATELNFSLYNAETGAVETQCFASLTYETNAVIGGFETPYVVRFRSTTGVNEFGKAVQIYPNPVERGQILTFGLSETEIGEVQVAIINAIGVTIETQCFASPKTSITIKAPDATGLYMLRVTSASGETYYGKLVVK